MDTYSASEPGGEASLTSPLCTEADILSRVGQIISADDMRQRGLWVFFLDRNHTQMPVVVPIDDVPDHPDLQLVGNVCWFVSQVLAENEPEGSAVITLSRPGTSDIGEVDRYWHRSLRAGAREHGTAIHMICLATPDGVRELAVAS